MVNFFDELRDRVDALPGVEAAGVVRALPLATTVGDFDINVEGFEESPGRDAKGDLQVVSDGAFEAMGARLVRGRWFTPADTMASVPVAVVNETMARAYWTDPAAVDRRPHSRRQRVRSPVGDRGRHRRRREAQRRDRDREREVLHSPQPVAQSSLPAATRFAACSWSRARPAIR